MSFEGSPVTEAEACVVGSGVAGGVVSQELLDAGVGSVLMLEAGGQVPMRDSRTWYDYVLRTDFDPFSEYGVSDDPAAYNEGPDHYLQRQIRLRGGSTVHWEGHCPRLKPEDFRLRSSVGQGEDWPLSYEELEPFYARAEATLRVSGDATDAGHPPRSGAFPLPALPYQRCNQTFLDAMEDLGFSTMHRPMARNTRAIDAMPQCQAIGTCRYCPIGGRFTGDQLIDRLALNPRFHLATGAVVERLDPQAGHRMGRARVLEPATGRSYDVVAPLFVVCAGGLETPKLLLRSHSSRHADGLGNSAGLVGAFLTSHVGSFRLGIRKNSEGLMDELLEFDTIVSRHFDDEANQAVGKFMLHHHMRVAPGPTDISGQRHWLRNLMMNGMGAEEVHSRLRGSVCHIVRASIEQFPERGNSIVNSTRRDRLGLPESRLHYAFGDHAKRATALAMERCDEVLEAMGCTTVSSVYAPSMHQHAHDMGTCRMSASPESGVVDLDLRLYGTDNVYVCSSAVFPTGGAANPTLTIVALAHRLGAHLAPRWRAQGGDSGSSLPLAPSSRGPAPGPTRRESRRRGRR